jgi:hypothetical protein
MPKAKPPMFSIMFMAVEWTVHTMPTIDIVLVFISLHNTDLTVTPRPQGAVFTLLHMSRTVHSTAINIIENIGGLALGIG